MPLGWLKKKVSDLGEAAWDAATEVGDAVTDVADAAVGAVGTVASSTGDVIGAVAGTVDLATFGVVSDVLHVVDNTVLDTLDTATGGIINIDYDDGNLSGSVGIEGIAHVGAMVGEDGVRHSASGLSQRFDVGLTEGGLDASGTAGIDWGPLPYADGNLTIDGEGDVAFDGTIQGTIPTPVGILSGRAEGSFVREEEMWGGHLDANGTVQFPEGGVVRGGVDLAYVETADGSAFNLGLEGSYTSPGVGTVGGSVGYQRIEQGDVVAEQFEGHAYAEGYGVRVDAGASHTSVSTPQGSMSEWDSSGDVSILGGPSQPASAPQVAAPEPTTDFDSAIADAESVETSVDEMFSDLG